MAMKLWPITYVDTWTEQNKKAHPDPACLATTKHTFLCCTWAATAVQNVLTAETALLAVEGKKEKTKHKKHHNTKNLSTFLLIVKARP